MTQDAGALLKLAEEYEAGLRKMESAGYEEFGEVIPKHKMIIAVLRQAASQGGADGEPNMTYERIEVAFDKWRKTLTVVDRPSNQDIFSHGFVAGWNAKEYASQGSAGEAVERCAKVADDFAAYEQTVLDRAHADEALSETGRESILHSAGSRQATAEQIAHDIRALSRPVSTGGAETMDTRENCQGPSEGN
jgi:hypothetical protein